MNKLQFSIIRNKELILFWICLISHAVFAPSFFYFGFAPVGWYSIASALVYCLLLCLYKKVSHLVLFTFSIIEIITYCVVVTIVTTNDAGAQLFTVCMVPSIYLLVYDRKKPKFYYLILSILAVAATFFIIIWDFKSEKTMNDDFKWVAWTLHYIYCLIVSVFIITALSFMSFFEMKRSQHKVAERNAALNYIANHDPLTGLFNRRKLQQYFGRYETAKQLGVTDYSVAIFDIDFFKKINDRYGHAAGDFVLKELSQFIISDLNEGAKLGRWGGEEFLIIFPRVNESVIAYLNELRQNIENHPFVYNDMPLSVTVTFGLSSSCAIDTMDKVIIDADTFLMFGKQNGRNQVVVSPKYQAGIK